ncbi:MBL fold metallo-hydrolase [Candidatus Falkowbacteria bacterium]|nr:MBL fold metallo-hydrolase [Candidatus Falkowbacteria bacterium]
MKRRLIAIAVLAAVATGLFLLLVISDRPAQARVDFLDVGQGDATLLQAPSGQRILIDGGPDRAVLGELARVLPFWTKEIDLVIISHFHEDHIGGLLSVAQNYKVKEAVFDSWQAPSQKVQEVLSGFKAEGVGLAVNRGRKKIDLGPGCGLELAGANQAEKDDNHSLIARFDCAGKSWLFLGDAPIEEQARFREELPDWRAETVKISHHGSDDGLDEAWLEQLGAKAAVIEVGKGNKYHHPSRRVLKKLERLGLEIRRTDLDGRVSFAYGP